jgi:hypothetical protein
VSRREYQIWFPSGQILESGHPDLHRQVRWYPVKQLYPR